MKTPSAIAFSLLFLFSQAHGREAKSNTPLATGAPTMLGVVYKTVDKRQLEFDMYYPVAGSATPCPVIVYTHGGGWAAGSRFGAANGSFATLFKTLVAKGFCIVSVDYRLCTKEGQTRMRDCVIDAKDAIRYLARNHESLGLDPNRFFVFGDSAGGHIAQMLLLASAKILPGDAELANVPYRIKAGASWYGPCDFEQTDLFNHNDSPDFRDRFGARITGADVTPEEKLRLYREMSPVNYLKKDSPPLLMIQGDKDTTIPVKHAYRMQKRAKELAAPVTISIVQNAGHNWRAVDADIKPSKDEIILETVTFFTKNSAN